MRLHLLRVRQRCAIGGTVRVASGSYRVDRWTYRALPINRLLDGSYGVWGGQRRTLDVLSPFTLERPTEVLGTGTYIVDDFTAKCVRSSQPRLVRSKLIRISAVIDPNDVDADDLIDWTDFDPPRTAEDVVREKMSAEELQARTDALMDRIANHARPAGTGNDGQAVSERRIVSDRHHLAELEAAQ